MLAPTAGINITLDVAQARHGQLMREAETARLLSSASHGKRRLRDRMRHGVGRALLSLGLRLQGTGQAAGDPAIRCADSVPARGAMETATGPLRTGEGATSAGRRPVLGVVQAGAALSADSCKLAVCSS